MAVVRLRAGPAFCAALAYLAAASFAAGAPEIVPNEPMFDLDDAGFYRMGYVLRGQPEHNFPIGWTGPTDELTGVTCSLLGELSGRRAVLVHPPWRTGPGLAFQEYTIKFPRCGRILLKGATALRAEAARESDGVTFRILCDGVKLLEVHHKDHLWQPFTLDLTRLAGKTSAIRFETDCGPNDNTNWDHALWGGRQIVLAGYKPKPVKRSNPPPLDLRKLRSAPNGTVVPPSGFDGKNETAVTGDTAVFRYTGPDGTLEYRWQRPKSGDDPLVGRMQLAARTPDVQVNVPIASSSQISWTAPAGFVSSRFERDAGGVTCVASYAVGGKEAAMRIAARLVGKSLILDISCSEPLVSRIDGLNWGPVGIRRYVAAPYYSGQVFYIPDADLFVNAFLDWTSSNASSHEGNAACYAPLTDQSRNCLRERAVFTAARHFAETLPNIPNPPSPYIKRIAGSIVLDIWGGNYTDIARRLETLWDYGIRGCIAIVHVWQRSGYDNALPAHLPANEALGGDEGMKKLVATATKLGYFIALHENYVDYYPNYDQFDESDIALDSNGNRVLGWYNGATRIQAFGTKPNAILKLAETQSPEIHRRYGTNACYIDVNSAVPPWYRVDHRAGEQGAGMFSRVWDVYGQFWQFERETHKGPVLGEGGHHWCWSGLLDGVEAQFGSGWMWNEGESAPLAVDFDLLKIHPLQFNHGMGYYERWTWNRGWGWVPPMVLLDHYRMQQVAYGHAGFLGSTTWRVLPCVWLEYHLLTPVTRLYASASPADVRYMLNGKWVDSTAAAKARRWDRVRVRYDNGLEIIANGAAAPLKVGGHILPQFGWLARGAGVTAYTALRDGVVADYAETQNSVFANARRASDWDFAKIWDIQPRVSKFEQTGPRRFRLAYEWQVGEKPPEGYKCFVHFVARDAKGGADLICFQDDHEIPYSDWCPGRRLTIGPRDIKVPDELPDGDYLCFIGLYRKDFLRLPIKGSDSSEQRSLLGTLQVRGSGADIRFEPHKPVVDQRLTTRFLKHLNLAARVVDFGTVRTNGSVFIRREGPDWVLTPMPRDKPFLIEINAAKFGSPAGAALDGGWWRLEMKTQKEYRWKAK